MEEKKKYLIINIYCNFLDFYFIKKIFPSFLCLQKLRNSVRSDFEACEICGQEYCSEPLHSTDDELLKEPLQEMNNFIQVVPEYSKKLQT